MACNSGYYKVQIITLEVWIAPARFLFRKVSGQGHAVQGTEGSCDVRGQEFKGHRGQTLVKNIES